MHEQLLAVARDDSGGFLSAVLQGMQAEIREIRRLAGTEHAEYPALIVEMIVVHQHHGALHSARLPLRPSPLHAPVASLR